MNRDPERCRARRSDGKPCGRSRPAARTSAGRTARVPRRFAPRPPSGCSTPRSARPWPGSAARGRGGRQPRSTRSPASPARCSPSRTPSASWSTSCARSASPTRRAGAAPQRGRHVRAGARPERAGARGHGAAQAGRAARRDRRSAGQHAGGAVDAGLAAAGVTGGSRGSRPSELSPRSPSIHLLGRWRRARCFLHLAATCWRQRVAADVLAARQVIARAAAHAEQWRGLRRARPAPPGRRRHGVGLVDGRRAFDCAALQLADELALAVCRADGEASGERPPSHGPSSAADAGARTRGNERRHTTPDTLRLLNQEVLPDDHDHRPRRLTAPTASSTRSTKHEARSIELLDAFHDCYFSGPGGTYDRDNAIKVAYHLAYSSNVFPTTAARSRCSPPTTVTTCSATPPMPARASRSSRPTSSAKYPPTSRTPRDRPALSLPTWKEPR